MLLSVASTGDGVASAAGNLLRPVLITFVGFGVVRLSQPVSPSAALLAALPAVGLQGDLNPPVDAAEQEEVLWGEDGGSDCIRWDYHRLLEGQVGWRSRKI